jgi:hypothetical protein
MMTLQELFAYVESLDFAAAIGVQSGLSVVNLVLEQDKLLTDLIHQAQTSNDALQKTYARLIELLRVNAELEHRHTHDEALTGYFYVLAQTNHELMQQAIDAFSNTPNLWWARRLAAELQQTDPTIATP